MGDYSDSGQLDWSAFWRVAPKDLDPLETAEWLDALKSVVESSGRERATYLLRRLLDHAREQRVPMPPVLNTPYCNTISLSEQAQFPGKLALRAGSEKRNCIRQEYRLD